MLHINVRLPQYVVDHFKRFPSYTKEIRSVLEMYVKEVEETEATHVDPSGIEVNENIEPQAEISDADESLLEALSQELDKTDD